MKLVFIRHGDPDYENDALTEQGVLEARLLAPRMPSLCADEYYVSPLGRAAQTAELALEGTGIKPKTLWWLEEFSHHVFRPDSPDRGRVGRMYKAVKPGLSGRFCECYTNADERHS